MIFYSGAPFFICFFLLLIPAIVLGVMGKFIRIYGLISSILLVGLILGQDKMQLIFLIAFYAVELGLVKLYLWLRNRFGRNPRIYGGFAFLTILPLTLCMEEKILCILEEICEDSIVKEDQDIQLFENDLLDSLTFTELLVAVEEEFGIVLSPSEISREDIETPNKIIALLKSRS